MVMTSQGGVSLQLWGSLKRRCLLFLLYVKTIHKESGNEKKLLVQLISFLSRILSHYFSV